MFHYSIEPGRLLRVIDLEEQRQRHAELVEQAVVAAEQGIHIHYHGGGTQWCNWDPACEGASPISELMI